MKEALLRLGSPLAAYLWDNPVFHKELRLQFRSTRTYLTQFAYLFLLGSVLTGLVSYAHLTAASGGRVALWQIGQWTFRIVVFLHTVFLAILMSSLAAGTITEERESRTLELLACLPMTTGMFVMGKYTSLLLLTGLLMLSSLPLLMLALSYVGGVTAGDFIASFIGLVGLCSVFAALGILASSLSNKTRSALLLCYRVLGLFLVLSWFVGILGVTMATTSYPYGRPAVPGAFGALAHPFIASSILACLLQLTVAGSLSSIMLTAAADHLRPPNEKLPHLLLVQFFVLHVVITTAFVLGAVGMNHAAAVAGAVYTPGPFPSMSFLMLEYGVLLSFSVLVLPERRPAREGWRGLFSVGPLNGSIFLGLCLAVSLLVPTLLAPAFSLAQSPGTGTLTSAGWWLGQGLAAAMIAFWSQLARVWTALWPKNARGAYIGTVIVLLVGPLVVQSTAFRETKVFFMNWLLALDPWLCLSEIDGPTSESLQRIFGIPIQPQMAAIGMLVAPCAAFLLAAWAQKLAEARK